MKKIFIVLFLLPFVTFSQGNRNFFWSVLASKPLGYYISASGNDANSGRSPSSPITVAKIPSLTLLSTDSLWFNKGDTFVFGDLNLSVSQVNISSYGTGAPPIFMGSISLSGSAWTNDGSGNYWVTPTLPFYWITSNGATSKNAVSNTLTISSTTSRTLTLNAASKTYVNGLSSIVGAKIRTYPGDWLISDAMTVTAYNSSTGVITVNRAVSVLTTLTSAFLYGQKQFLASQGDFWYDSTNVKVYVKSTTTPAGTNIRQISYKGLLTAINSSTGPVLNKKIYMHDVKLTQYYERTLAIGSNSTVKRVTIYNNRGIGIYANNASNLSITNVTIHDNDFSGMFLYRVTSSNIANDSVYNIGAGQTIGYPHFVDSIAINYPLKAYGTDFNGYGIACIYGSSNTMQYNRVYRTAYDAIASFVSAYNTVDHCYVTDPANQTFSDAGGIDIGGYNSTYKETNVTVTNNIVDDTHAVHVLGRTNGIYIDNYTNTGTVNNNAVNNQPFCGIIINFKTTSISVTNNTVGNCGGTTLGTGGIIIVDNDNTSVGHIVTGNTIISTNNSAMPMLITSSSSSTYNPFSSGGNCNNNLYINPYGTNVVVNIYTGGSPFTNYYTLAGWQTFRGLDGTSTSRTNYLSFYNVEGGFYQHKFAPNWTNASVNVTPLATPLTSSTMWLDMTGAGISSTITVPSYSGVYYYSKYPIVAYYDNGNSYMANDGSQWIDKANGNNLTAAGALRPAYNASGQHSLPSYTFTGTEIMTGPLIPAAQLSQHISLWIVCNGGVITHEANISNRSALGQFTDFKFYEGISVGGTSYGVYNSTNAYHVGLATFDGTQSTNATKEAVYIDNVLTTAASFSGTLASTTEGQTTSIVQMGKSGTSYYTGTTSEACILLGTISSTDAATISAALKTKYGL